MSQEEVGSCFAIVDHRDRVADQNRIDSEEAVHMVNLTVHIARLAGSGRTHPEPAAVDHKEVAGKEADHMNSAVATAAVHSLADTVRVVVHTYSDVTILDSDMGSAAAYV